MKFPRRGEVQSWVWLHFQTVAWARKHKGLADLCRKE
jgi:hypothetical protein